MRHKAVNTAEHSTVYLLFVSICPCTFLLLSDPRCHRSWRHVLGLDLVCFSLICSGPSKKETELTEFEQQLDHHGMMTSINCSSTKHYMCLLLATTTETDMIRLCRRLELAWCDKRMNKSTNDSTRFPALIPSCFSLFELNT